MLKPKSIYLVSIFSFLLFLADRVLKIILIKKLSAGGKFFIFKNWFSFDLAYNRGLIFGLDFNYGLILFFYLLAFFLLFWVLILAIKNEKHFLALFLNLIIFGAFSNFLDRLCFGAVVDYFNFINLTVFNLADAMIVSGVIGLMLTSFIKEGQEVS